MCCKRNLRTWSLYDIPACGLGGRNWPSKIYWLTVENARLAANSAATYGFVAKPKRRLAAVIVSCPPGTLLTTRNVRNTEDAFSDNCLRPLAESHRQPLSKRHTNSILEKSFVKLD